MANLSLKHKDSNYAPVLITDIGFKPQLGIYENGQSQYVAYNNTISLIRTGSVELSLDRGDIKGYIDARAETTYATNRRVG